MVDDNPQLTDVGRNNAFTYCGDLVGTSSMYANAPSEAYRFLNRFYNTVFGLLANYQHGVPAREVYMFSDSIIVTGDSPEEFVRSMCGVYMTLLNSSLLLRGGMVAGRLEFDPRQTRENFQKMLPQGDALARANALEKSVKGARFIVAPEIASQLVGSRREWLTLQGYIADPLLGADVPLQRSVAPVANGGGFEILYPVHERERADDATLSRDVEHLLYLVNASPPEVAVHYGETIAVIRHSQLRRTHMSRRVVP